jgi:NADH dehydrogenase FAD-containing subunit
MLVTRDAFERGYAPAAREHFLKVFARLGITLRTGIDVQRVDADHLVTNEGDLPFALCLWAGSFRGMALGRESGLAVNARDQVLVDASLRSLTAPEIYVAGDSAALPAAYAPFLVMGCKTAMPLGAHVAQNLLDEMRGATPAPLNFAYSATCISLGRQDGLVQILQPNGEPAKIFLTGRLGAWVKEMICRFTVTVLRFERHVNAYDWVAAKPPRQKAATPVASAVQSPSV